MTWIDGLWLALAALAGVAIGLFYFGGLWLTTQRLVSAQRPALLFMASYLVRLVVALGGFYLVSGGRWERMVACLAGFLLGRAWMLRKSREQTQI